MLSDIGVCLITIAALEAAKRFGGPEFAYGAAAGLAYCATLMLIRERRASPNTAEGRTDRA